MVTKKELNELELKLDRLEDLKPIRVKHKDRSVLVQLTEEELAYLKYERPRKGTSRLAVELGLKKVFRCAKHAVGWGLVGAAGAAMKGADVTTALFVGACSAVAGPIVSIGTDKTVREYQKISDKNLSKWEALFYLLSELLKLVTNWKKGEKT